MISKSAYLDVPLQEMQRTYEAELAGIDSMKTTIRTIFGSASLIVSLASALQLFSHGVVPGWLSLYQNGILLSAVLYVVLIIVCILGMWPVYTIGPILADWNELTTAYQNLDEHEIKLKQLSATLNAIDLNRPMVTRFLRLERTALILLPILVTLLLLLAWIPRT